MIVWAIKNSEGLYYQGEICGFTYLSCCEFFGVKEDAETEIDIMKLEHCKPVMILLKELEEENEN